MFCLCFLLLFYFGGMNMYLFLFCKSIVFRKVSGWVFWLLRFSLIIRLGWYLSEVVVCFSLCFFMIFNSIVWFVYLLIIMFFWGFLSLVLFYDLGFVDGLG